MTPYLASLEWWAAALSGRELTPRRGRWNRTMLSSGNWLTIPVKGGIATVKHVDPLLWQADDSRSWRRNHIGAISAELGRTPFYNFYAEPVIEVIADTDVTEVEKIATEIHRRLTADMPWEKFINEWQTLSAQRAEMILNYGKALKADAESDDTALLSWLCRFGPDTIFILADTLLR